MQNGTHFWAMHRWPSTLSFLLSGHRGQQGVAAIAGMLLNEAPARDSGIVLEEKKEVAGSILYPRGLQPPPIICHLQ